MQPLDLFGMVRRNLLRQPLRSSLTVLGAALGVVAIIALASIVQGMTRTLDAALQLGGADLSVFQANVAADIFSSLELEPTRAKLLSDPDVAAATAGLSYVMPVGDQRFTVVLGVESDGFTYSTEYVDGPPIREADEASLGAIAARTLGKQRGDLLELGGRSFRVVSIFQSGVVIYDAAITVRIDTLQEMTGRQGRATAFFLDLRPGADVQQVGRRLEQSNPELVAISDVSEYHKVDAGLESSRSAVWAVTLAAIAIGSVILLNTMWMSVLERTREIGVLRAVGWSARQIMSLVLLESLLVGLASLVVGSVLGVAAAYAAALAPVTSQFLRPSFTIMPFLLAGVASVSLSLLGGALPAWRAMNISPAEALRYE